MRSWSEPVPVWTSPAIAVPSRETCLTRASRLLVAVLVPVLCVSAAGAQDAATGVVIGRATDASGAPLAKARVAVTRTATAAVRETTTDSAGRYALASLAPGEYRVSIEMPGFAPKALDHVVVEVGRRVPADAVLDVGGRAEAVSVEERVIPVATGSSLVGGVVSSGVVESLPLNGRNFLELAFLFPGNAPAPGFDPTKSNTLALSSAGQLGRGGNITIDGQDNNDDVVGGPLANLPQDAVQEFQMATNRFSAEQGRSAVSAVNVVTRSGTDTFSGTATFLYRDDTLQGLPATFDRSSGPAPPFSREQYSATLGGPIVRGKAWWFAAAEYRNQDAVVQVGERDTATRTIRQELAPAPLTDFLGLARVDVHASDSDTLSLRYVAEDQKDTAASTLDRSIGSASQRQESSNKHQQGLATWTRTLGQTSVNTLRASYSDYRNSIEPVVPGRQLTFPSVQDGTSFRVPQGTTQRRWQVSDSLSWVKGAHTLRFGGEAAHTYGSFDLGVFRDGRVEMVQDFPQFDLNQDGVVNDDDLLFSVTLRSGKPDQDLVLDDCSSTYLAGFVQDDWRLTPQLTLNLGLRYELDTNVKNISGYADTNPIVAPFYQGTRGRDLDNFGPRVGLAWASRGGSFQLHGGWGLYYDRVTLEIMSLERGLDGRALPIEVRAGNAFFLDPATGTMPPNAPTFANPFTGFILPGAGASGINIIDNTLENPTVQQFNLGTRLRLLGQAVLQLDLVHNRGTHFIIGRPIGDVYNPVVGGPDRVVNIESSVGTRYDGLLASLEERWGNGHQVRVSYSLARARNYVNDDQIPFGSGPIDPNDLELEYGPTPNEQRQRLVVSGSFQLPAALQLSGIWTLASGVPMDILMPDASRRVPTLSRNAGARVFKTASELNSYIGSLNASGGIEGVLLPLVREDARFSDSFDSLDLRLSRRFVVTRSLSLEAIVECFNVFNVTNILGVSKTNYSGFANVLARDSSDPSDPGFLRSSSFGGALTTAGGVFGSGGPRAFQLGLRAQF